jgi:hypothetical protein
MNITEQVDTTIEVFKKLDNNQYVTNQELFTAKQTVEEFQRYQQYFPNTVSRVIQEDNIQRFYNYRLNERGFISD